MMALGQDDMKAIAFDLCVTDPMYGVLKSMQTLNAAKVGMIMGILQSAGTEPGVVQKAYDEYKVKIDSITKKVVDLLNSIEDSHDGDTMVALIQVMADSLASHINGVRTKYPDVRTGAYSDGSYQQAIDYATGKADSNVMKTLTMFKLKMKTLSMSELMNSGCDCPSCSEIRNANNNAKRMEDNLKDANSGKEVA
jgi:hypothetical protein